MRRAEKKARVGVAGAFAAPLAPHYDAPIMAQLPREGAMAGQIKPLALTAKHISVRLGGELAPLEIAARLSTLRAHGAVVDVVLVPVSQGRGWQLTLKGEAILAQMQSELEVAHG